MWQGIERNKNQFIEGDELVSFPIYNINTKTNRLSHLVYCMR